MRLTENNEDITYNKVSDMIYLKEKNVRKSNWNIWNKQRMDISNLILSNYLIHNIHNEINRE